MRLPHAEGVVAAPVEVHLAGEEELALEVRLEVVEDKEEKEEKEEVVVEVVVEEEVVEVVG